MSRAPPPKRLRRSEYASSSALDAARATKQILAAQNAESRITAARAVAAVSYDTDDDSDIALRDAIRPLTEMLRGAHDESEAAALALSKLSRIVDNRFFIVNAATRFRRSSPSYRREPTGGRGTLRRHNEISPSTTQRQRGCHRQGRGDIAARRAPRDRDNGRGEGAGCGSACRARRQEPGCHHQVRGDFATCDPPRERNR